MARQTKKGVISESVRTTRKNAQQVSIEERLAGCGRQEPEHIEYVGTIVETVLKSEFGAILKALTAGRLSMELYSSKTSNRSSDWHLGRASMANDLWHDFEQFVIDADKLRQPKEIEIHQESDSPE